MGMGCLLFCLILLGEERFFSTIFVDGNVSNCELRIDGSEIMFVSVVY